MVGFQSHVLHCFLQPFKPVQTILGHKQIGREEEWSREGRAWFAASIDSLFSAM